MASNDYLFVTRWRIKGTIEEVYDLLSDPLQLTRWWPDVYLDVKEEEPGQPGGVGRVIDLYTKGWLPYRLRWKFRVTEAQRPTRMSLEAWGDFVGTGVWDLRQDGDTADVTYTWTIRADKPLLRSLSWLMKPVFQWNHQWAMKKGSESLVRELARTT